MRHVVLLTCFLLAGCSDGPTKPGAEHTFATEQENGFTWALQHGIVEFYGDSVRIDLPAAARTGETFTVTVGSIGEHCSRPGETRVDSETAKAIILPLDWNVADSQDRACISIMRVHEHTAELSFDSPGTAIVQVRGLRHPERKIVTRSFEVEIRP